MEIINMLGEKLSLKINISPPAVRGLLKLAIKDEIGPFKPLNQLNYEDFKKSIENALKIRLEKLDIKNSKKIIDILINELKKIQSIITIGGV
ncbi:MAG: hypothetical protein ACFFA7_12750 [Promethearchaeota archaeon]